MPQPLIILSPPRSFSSVVSTMIGQHPQLYGFPELHLFAWDTVGEVIQNRENQGKFAPPGIIRTLAQELYGVQNTKTIIQAIEWLQQRKKWSTKQLFDYILELVNPKIGVEKTPRTSRNKRHLERAYQMFPGAYYLHLTRHPVSTRKSISSRKNTKEFYSKRKREKATDTTKDKNYVDGFLWWLVAHKNILDFTNTLPVGQTMRIKGEDLLSQPDLYLTQIAQWLGLRTDNEAIEAMKHPENSPYAYVGSYPARGGNDMKFMRNPKLRSGKVVEPSLQDCFSKSDTNFFLDNTDKILEENGFEFASQKALFEEITSLSQVMGYQ